MKFSPKFSEGFSDGKISEICQNCQKYFPGDFSPEEVSPGELSGSCHRKNTCLQPWIYIFWIGNIIVISFGTSWSRDKQFLKSFPEVFRKSVNNFGIKMCKYLVTAGKLYFLLIKFQDTLPEVFRNVPLSEKISEIWQNCQKYFPGDFSPEEISPGEFSGICWNKRIVYSRKIVLFEDVTSQ